MAIRITEIATARVIAFALEMSPTDFEFRLCAATAIRGRHYITSITNRGTSTACVGDAQRIRNRGNVCLLITENI